MIDNSLNEKNELCYNKYNANLIAGVGILLMLFHHFFGFSHYLKPGVLYTSIFPTDIGLIFTRFAKICVTIFAFNTGYAMWAKKESYTYSKIPMRIFKFLLQYWIICILFILYAVITGDTLPTLKQFVNNLFGLELHPEQFVCVSFAWYVYFYVIVMVLSPLLISFFKRGNFTLNFIVACVIVLLLLITQKMIHKSFVTSCLSEYLSAVFLGMLVCKFNIFNSIYKLAKYKNVIFYFILIILTIIFHKLIFSVPFLGANKNTIIIIPFIFGILSILKSIKSEIIKKTLTLFGNYSMNMWFVHAIFFTGTIDTIQRVLYAPKYSIIIYVWGVLITLILAMFCSYLQNKLLSFLFKNK